MPENPRLEDIARPALKSNITKVIATSGTANRWRDFWLIGGMPAAGAAGPNITGTALSGPTTGGIPIPGPATDKRIYLSYMEFAHHRTDASPGLGIASVCIYDRLWHNAYTPDSTALQSFTMSALPARDQNGASDGAGVMLASYSNSATTVTTITVSYTNHLGVAGRTASIPVPTATNGQGLMIPAQLQAGDTGVRSVQSLQQSAAIGGAGSTHGLVLFRRISSIGVPVAGEPSRLGAMDLALPRIYDDSVLSIITNMAAAAVPVLQGSVHFVQV